MNIILSAYYCHPEKGSEQGVGWNWLKELSKRNTVWCLIYAGEEQENAVSQAISTLPWKHNITLLSISIPDLFCGPLYRINYEIWQWKAYKRALRLVEQERIDLVHHVTIAAWWNCGHMWRLSRPFIFGPISGAQQTPIASYSFLRPSDRVYEAYRTFLFHLAWNLWRRPRRAIEAAAVVLAANPGTLNKVIAIRQNKPTLLLSATGISSVETFESTAFKEKTISYYPTFNLLWCGKIIALKNFGLVLDVLASLPRNARWHLNVAGTGNLIYYWKRKIALNKLCDKVTFLGNVPYQEMSNLYRQANILLFTSLREGTPTVILEAMAHGRPIISLKESGAMTVLDSSCGILIPIHNKTQMVTDFRKAILRLWHDPELRESIGRAALKKVTSDYLWERRGIRMQQIYNESIGDSVYTR